MIPTAEALAAIAAVLEAGGIAAPRREARLILAHAIGADPAVLFATAMVPASAGLEIAARRAGHEPLAYITGRREFWSLDFDVSRATLIPRPDSETLIEAAIRHCPDRAAVATILDLGTGTGALLLAALAEFPAAFGIGTDRVAEAARLAHRNAARLGFGGRAGFVVADWAAPLIGRFDLVLANPPYIPTGAIAALMPEVAAFEPATALDGGADGLAAYRLIIAALPRLLAPCGVAIIEAGIGQAGAITAIAGAHDLAATADTDLAGIQRAIVITGVGRGASG